MSDPDKQPIAIEKIRSLVFDVIVHNFKVDRTTLAESTDFTKDLKADARNDAAFKKEIEKVFGITIGADKMAELTTAGRIVELIDSIFNK
jgi:acyl carrier protein